MGLFVEFCDGGDIDCEDAAYYCDECLEHGVMVFMFLLSFRVGSCIIV